MNIQKKINKIMKDEIEFFKKIVEINSGTLNKDGVDRVSNIFVEEFKKIGFKYTKYVDEKIGNLSYLKSEYRKNLPRILLSGHVDTVFEKESEFQNFSINGKNAFGPGVADMKGGLVVMLFAVKELFEKYKNLYNIDILLIPDEEKGSLTHRKEIKKIYKKYDFGLNFEPTGKINELIEKRKGAAFVEIETRGKAGHSGYFTGIYPNAIEKMAKIIPEILELQNYRKGTTINLGKIWGGEKANIIAESTKIIFDIRYWERLEYDRVIEGLRILKEKYNFKITISDLMPSFEIIDMTEELKKVIQNINKKIIFIKREGGSDAGLMSNSGLATIDGFGLVGINFHNSKEKVNIFSLDKKKELTKKVLESLLLMNK